MGDQRSDRIGIVYNIRQIWIFLIVLNAVLATILLIEFTALRQQANALIELQGEYQNYIVALRSVLDDSAKDGPEVSEVGINGAEEKKKPFCL